MITIHAKSNRNFAKKQQGATLVTALVFLTLMTIVSVSAAKISMLDVLVSGNNQQQMVLYQKTSRDLNAHAKPTRLLKLLIEDEGEANNYKEEWAYNFEVAENNPNTNEKITNRVIEYQCGAINGLATSQGSNNSCRLFDFEVKTKKSNSNGRDRQVRGAGKEYPTAARNNLIRR